MALTYGFYDAVYSGGQYDREYTAMQLSSIFDGVITDGVFQSVGNHLATSKGSSGLTVNVGTGRAWFNHTWTCNDSPYPITLSDADPANPRYDAIVLKIDLDNRENSIYAITGHASASPSYPPIPGNVTNSVYYYLLSTVVVTANATSPTGLTVNNRIGMTYSQATLKRAAPWAAGLLEHPGITDLINTWNSEFQTVEDNFNEAIIQISGGTGVELKAVVGYNITVASGSWSTFTATSGSEEAKIKALGYNYRTKILLDGVVSTMRPLVTWSISDVEASGISILNQYNCGAGGVFAYADAQPSSDIQVLTLECRRTQASS